MHFVSRDKRQRGYTLVELGVVVAAIVILMTAVLIGRGMLQSARVASTVEMVHSLRKAALACMERGGKAAFTGCTLANLQAPPYNLISATPKNPFGDALTITVAPEGAGDSKIAITVETIGGDANDDVAAALTRGASGTVTKPDATHVKLLAP